MDRDKRVIWKYPLKITDEQSVAIPSGAEILTAQMQGYDLCIWAMVYPRERMVERKVFIHGTGHPIDQQHGQYIGSVQQSVFVWHVFAEVD